VVPSLELLVQARQAVEHLQSGTQSTLGVVLADRRHAEDSHDRVADELLDGSTPVLNHARHRAEILVQDPAQALGIQALAECCGPNDISKENGYKFPFGCHPVLRPS
jgi:hypothetical protein